MFVVSSAEHYFAQQILLSWLILPMLNQATVKESIALLLLGSGMEKMASSISPSSVLDSYQSAPEERQGPYV